jgi:hypothetical protein
MRKPIVLAALASLAAIVLWAAPASAMQRVASPSGEGTLVARIADADKPAARKDRKHRHARIHRHGRGDAYWHYRLSASRWLHYQYVNAGYPARRYEGEVYYTYFPGDDCCRHHRYWGWYGRKHGHHHGHAHGHHHGHW